jgi:hypothetical protein
VVLVEYVLGIFWYNLVVPDISYVFLVSNTQVPFCLAYVALLTALAFQFINTIIAIFIELSTDITVDLKSIINTICYLQSGILKYFCQRSNTIPEIHKLDPLFIYF